MSQHYISYPFKVTKMTNKLSAEKVVLKYKKNVNAKEYCPSDHLHELQIDVLTYTEIQ